MPIPIPIRTSLAFDLAFSQYNVIEDCVAAGTGRKMIMTYKSNNNTIRRCFTYWQEWDGRDSVAYCWPNGQMHPGLSWQSTTLLRTISPLALYLNLDLGTG
jgi:hypothetical protein